MAVLEPKYRHVGVLMGGPSDERAVSLRSGTAIANGLIEAGCRVEEIDVKEPSLTLPGGLDAVFIALHGAYGEDGTVQEELETRGMPYTGSGPEASRVAFDKLASKKAFADAGVRTPAYEVLDHPGDCDWPFPYIVKPLRQGSSIGLVRVFSEPDRQTAKTTAEAIPGPWLIEEYIAGRELTVGLIEEAVFPVLEICAPEGFYNYEAKYTPGSTEYRVPAPLPDSVADACRAAAETVFRHLGCRGLSRVDFRLDAENRPWVLEINTIPGFTETSLLPKAAGAAGIGFSDLCVKILNSA